jgi:hypothetical protein
MKRIAGSVGALLLVASLSACGGSDNVTEKAKDLAPFVPGDLFAAAKSAVDMWVPGLSAEEVSGVGAKVCRSLEKRESQEKTRQVVRDAMKQIGRDGLEEAVKNDRFADKVITAFKGPYCSRIKAQPK